MRIFTNEGYTSKQLRLVEQVLKTMKAQGVTEEELFSHNAASTDAILADGRGNRGGSRPEKRKTEGQQEHPFLRPGEGEVISGLKCCCGGSFHVEALCVKTAIKNKCVRIAYCVECGNEVKIR